MFIQEFLYKTIIKLVYKNIYYLFSFLLFFENLEKQSYRINFIKSEIWYCLLKIVTTVEAR